MKKHIALFLVVAMLLALCACTSQPAKDTTSEQTTADASSNSDAAANTDDFNCNNATRIIVHVKIHLHLS